MGEHIRLVVHSVRWPDSGLLHTCNMWHVELKNVFCLIYSLFVRRCLAIWKIASVTYILFNFVLMPQMNLLCQFFFFLSVFSRVVFCTSIAFFCTLSKVYTLFFCKNLPQAFMVILKKHRINLSYSWILNWNRRYPFQSVQALPVKRAFLSMNDRNFVSSVIIWAVYDFYLLHLYYLWIINSFG